MHTIARHDGVSHQWKTQIGVSRRCLVVLRLRNDIGNLAILPEQSVESLFWELLGGSSGLRWDEFNLDEVGGIPVEILEPRCSADKAGLDSSKWVKPWLQRFFLQLGDENF